MCGLWGGAALGKLASIDVDRIADLCVLSWVRGTDSTGMFDVVQKDKIKHPLRIWKTTQHPFDFATIRLPEVLNTRWKDNLPTIIAGHNRYATVGKITQRNCHPFSTNKIVGMHNGTITSDFPGKDKYETDSEGLINLISEVGIHKAISELDTYRSAYALIWFDAQQHKLFFLRNKERTLWQVKYGGVLFWASERRLLNFMMDSHRSTNAEPTILKEDTLYSLDLSKHVTELVEGDKIEGRYKPPIISRQNWWRSETADNFQDVDWIPEKHTKLTPENIIKEYERDLTEVEKDIQRVLTMGNIKNTDFYDKFDAPSGKYFTEYQITSLAQYRERFDKVTGFLKAFKDRQVEKNKTSVIPFVQKEKGELNFNRPFGTKGEKCTELAYREKLKCGCHACSDPVSIQEEIYWIDEKNFICEVCQDEAATTKNSYLTHLANFDFQSFLDFVEKRWSKDFEKGPQVKSLH